MEIVISGLSMVAAMVVTFIMVCAMAPKDRVFSNATVMIMLCAAVIGVLLPYHILPALG